jgi:hypothetical protein
MKTYTCITSMTQKMHDHIGSVMIDSWSRYWPSGKLILYLEKFSIKGNDKIIVKDWNEHCESEHYKFSKSTNDKSSIRFAKKGFSFLHSLETINTDYIVWIDADIIFHKFFPNEKLNSILDENKLVAFFDCYYQDNPNYSHDEYIDAKNRPYMAAESGFVIVNTKHKNFEEYRNNYRKYFTASSKPKECRYWYDGEIVVISASPFLDQVIDLSSLRSTNKTQTPLNRSWLAEYFTHQKGRSKEGYTTEDLQKFTIDRHA